eukprot:8571513-Pyramimonas_sp.AAC.1
MGGGTTTARPHDSVLRWRPADAPRRVDQGVWGKSQLWWLARAGPVRPVRLTARLGARFWATATHWGS